MWTKKPPEPWEMMDLGDRHRIAGRHREAVEAYRAWVGLDPGNPLPLLRLAEQLVVMGEIPESLPEFAEGARLLVVLDRFPDALKVIARRLYLGPIDHAEFARALLSSTKDTPRVFIARVNAELPKYPSLAPLVAAMEAQRLS